MDAKYSLEHHNQNDGWLMVNTKDGSRSPQYNGDNEPSGHKANASTSPSRHNSFSFEEVEVFEPYQPPSLSQKTISNGSSETMTSGNTTFAGAQIAPPRAQYDTNRRSSKAKETLTQSNLYRHEHLAAVNVSGWIDNSGTGFRYAQYETDRTTYGSMVAEECVPNATSSSTNGDTYGVQSSVGDDDIRAAGAWSGPILEDFIRSWRSDSE
ncbi:hypothetical protein V8F20_001910 [Naviculisporaceae sp. PSN 640]